MVSLSTCNKVWLPPIGIPICSQVWWKFQSHTLAWKNYSTASHWPDNRFLHPYYYSWSLGGERRPVVYLQVEFPTFSPPKTWLNITAWERRSKNNLCDWLLGTWATTILEQHFLSTVRNILGTSTGGYYVWHYMALSLPDGSYMKRMLRCWS